MENKIIYENINVKTDFINNWIKTKKYIRLNIQLIFL